MREGIFPKNFKISTISPIYKNKGSRMDLQNYRPIAVLSNVGKILEKLIHNRLDKYLESNNIITPRQFGFRRGLGTDGTLLQLTTFLHEKIDINKKKYCYIFRHKDSIRLC